MLQKEKGEHGEYKYSWGEERCLDISWSICVGVIEAITDRNNVST